MTNEYLEHPSEEAMERLLLHRAGDEEVEVLETHFLACEPCLTRFEALELQISDLRAALTASEQQRAAQEQKHSESRWRNWFTLPTLSWAGGACALLAVGLTVAPHYLQQRATLASRNTPAVAEMSLSGCRSSADSDLAACRGTESPVLPQGRPLNLRVETTDIAQGPVDVQVVDGSGGEIWQGQTEVKQERAEVKLPKIAQPGPYFLRFYAPSAGSEHELVREFRFEVK